MTDGLFDFAVVAADRTFRARPVDSLADRVPIGFRSEIFDAGIAAHVECFCPDIFYAFGDDDNTHVEAPVKSVVADFRDAFRDDDSGQFFATSKRVFADFGNAVRDDNVGQGGTAGEGVFPNFGYAVGN